jgi:chemotaxis-related protein WspB
MLFVLFHLGPDRYAIDAGMVAEILPLVGIKSLPQAPRAVSGVFNFHGSPVPVVDLSRLALGRPSRGRLSTRIILVRYPTEGGERLLGLLAEKATETLRRDPADFVSSGVADDQAPYLGPVMADDRGIVQWIDVKTLLPPSITAVLFPREAVRA